MISLLQVQKFRGKTGDNMADKNYLHTAYANSADGTDGFTTVYPNLNLLNNTIITEESLTPENWSALGGSSLSVGSNNGIKVINNGGAVGSIGGFTYGPTINVKAGDQITISGSVKNTGTAEIKRFGLLIALSGTSSSYPAKDNFVVPNDGKYHFFSFTIEVPSGTTTARPRWMDIAIVLNEQHIFEVIGMKLETGKIATPYMPSASEVTTADWPKYVGTYVDTNPVSSTDPSKYVWDEMKYRVYLDGVAVGGSKLLSFDLENLTSGTTYNVQVNQTNGNDESDKSESVAFKTLLTN